MGISSSDEDTIAAIATAVAAGHGGIAVIRISGPAAEDVGKSVVSTPGQQHWNSHTILYGHVIDKPSQAPIDEVLVLVMKGPRSFTGEDTVEVHCHGGLIAVQRVLDRILDHPNVRRALPGEFSQRAVLNGRLELTQAEAISDLIAARSRKAAQLAMNGVDGGIQRRINSLRKDLLDQLSELEARVDFEDELPPLDGEQILNELMKVKLALMKLIEDANKGDCLRQGLKVAIIGRPNVGKSSLLNRLSKNERAIVTDLPGTTRDLLESEVVLEGVPIMLLDTAGIRPTHDQVEKLGIARSHEALQSADVVVLIYDLTMGWTHEEQNLLQAIPDQVPKLLVANKSDLYSQSTNHSNKRKLSETKADVIFSALTGQGEETLISALLTICGAHGMTRPRHT